MSNNIHRLVRLAFRRTSVFDATRHRLAIFAARLALAVIAGLTVVAVFSILAQGWAGLVILGLIGVVVWLTYKHSRRV